MTILAIWQEKDDKNRKEVKLMADKKGSRSDPRKGSSTGSGKGGSKGGYRSPSPSRGTGSRSRGGNQGGKK